MQPCKPPCQHHFHFIRHAHASLAVLLRGLTFLIRFLHQTRRKHAADTTNLTMISNKHCRIIVADDANTGIMNRWMQTVATRHDITCATDTIRFAQSAVTSPTASTN
jgi:hypothetical protein